MKIAVRTLAIVAVLALLVWGMNEAAAAARPTLPEPPAAVSIEDGSELAASTDAVSRPLVTLRERPKLGHHVAVDAPECAAHARAAWHPTRHACDGSPDH